MNSGESKTLTELEFRLRFLLRKLICKTQTTDKLSFFLFFFAFLAGKTVPRLVPFSIFRCWWRNIVNFLKKEIFFWKIISSIFKIGKSFPQVISNWEIIYNLSFEFTIYFYNLSLRIGKSFQQAISNWTIIYKSIYNPTFSLMNDIRINTKFT